MNERVASWAENAATKLLNSPGSCDFENQLSVFSNQLSVDFYCSLITVHCSLITSRHRFAPVTCLRGWYRREILPIQMDCDKVLVASKFGPVAQLGEHHNGIVGVKGSSPFRSTKFYLIPSNRVVPRKPFFVSEREKGFFCLEIRDWRLT